MVGYGLLCLALIALDQWTKWLVTSSMELGESIPVIENVFHLTYVQNTGAAFSILEGKQWLLLGVTGLLLAAIIVYVVWKRPQGRMLLLSLSMIVAGGVGNLMDRLRLGYVVDFFDARIIRFAVFNVADIFVVCGTILLAVWFLFFEGKKEARGED